MATLNELMLETTKNLTKEELIEYSNLLNKFNADYRSDEKLRARIDGGDITPLFEALGSDVPEIIGTDVQLRVVADTDKVQHMVIPPDPTWLLQDSDMSNISGGSTVGSAGSVGSTSTFLTSTGPSSIGTIGSAGTAGSAQV